MAHSQRLLSAAEPCFAPRPAGPRLGGELRLTLLLLAALLLGLQSAQAQWLTQSFTLRPGWNAIYLHVDPSYQSLDEMIPDANGPVAEVWYWRPKLTSAQFTDSPSNPTGTDSRWSVWTSARGNTDTLSRLVGNGAYLVLNRTAADYTLSVKGKPLPPDYAWTTTGLNFIGFPTPAGAAPNFATFLKPVPGLDLANSTVNGAQVFRYLGREADPGAGPIPSNLVSFLASSALVRRGEAFWVRGASNYYNHYYGPVELDLQNPSGIDFLQDLATYTMRLKNRTATNRTVTLSLVASETPPAGQGTLAGAPQLLVRGALSPTTLTYQHSVLSTLTVDLAAEGDGDGWTKEIVLGVNRTAMTAASGSVYGAILRITDSAGLQQVDIPVSATVADASGLWVGQATVDRVGQYLKSYPKVKDTNAASLSAALNTALASVGRAGQGKEVPGAPWTHLAVSSFRSLDAVASSADGRRAVIAAQNTSEETVYTPYSVTPAAPGGLFVTSDYGATWSEREVRTNRSFLTAACSEDGNVMVAGTRYAGILVSTDAGTNWVTRGATNAVWLGVACSADGQKLAAVTNGRKIALSTDGGVTWTDSLSVENWSSVCMSGDGATIAACTDMPGGIYVSRDSGTTWRRTQQDNRPWQRLVCSADGRRMAALDNRAGVMISVDGGGSWQTRIDGGNYRFFNSIAMSGDGLHLALTGLSGNGGFGLPVYSVYFSDDGGLSWTNSLPAPSTETGYQVGGIALSSDSTRVIALGPREILTRQRTFASYDVDPTSGLILDQAGRYVGGGVNTNLAKVVTPVPLRLILHNDAAASRVSLLQRVFVGKGAQSSSNIVTHREQLLDSAQLASARRITAPHLPFSLTNTFWTTTGNFNAGSNVALTVDLDYNDQASNPFLHTFHPDHDNLDAKFKQVRARGEESYSITRQIRLAFEPAGSDFRSLTGGAYRRGGTYEETIILGGKGGASREFHLSGTFSLQRISSVSTLSTAP